ncbi:uncharacterized protein isoform X2 [Leptinotarsa decemlineata]|uniref:uncharacterized protein isoform X2 n=1 Tax=Leptinotarsa decemlineata TaxID=7539 RepID=UPI000C254F67|nr:uncharacterized protein LOC111515684 isoform X2 [Leptinotarsa decemlineata]
MNKLHNFSFVGEFPMFESPEDNGNLSFIKCPRNNLRLLSQEIYLPPFDNSRAYYDLTENQAEITTYSLKFLEGCESNEDVRNGSMLDEFNISNMDTEFIFLENFNEDLQSELPDISLQDIFLDPQVMNSSDNYQEKTSKSDFSFTENDIMNLYYLNENPVREKKTRNPKIGKENKNTRKKRHLLH